MQLIKRLSSSSRTQLSTLTLGLTLGMSSLAYSEPWLQFCKSEFECGYKTASNEVMIKSENMFYILAPKVLTDEMRANDEIRLSFTKDKRRDGTSGFMNAKGEIVIPPRFERVSSRQFKGQYAIVKLEGKLTLVNWVGKVSKLRAESIFTISSAHARFMVERNSKWELTDFGGKSVNGKQYESFPSWSDKSQRIIYKKDEKFGVIDFQGRDVLPANYDNIKIADVPFMIAKSNGKEALYDISGRSITEFIYDEIYLPRDDKMENNAIAVVKDGKTGLIGFDGKPITDFNYKIPISSGNKRADEVYRYKLAFSEGLGGYFKNDKAGYIDKTGKVIIPHNSYIINGHFRDGLAKVVLSNKKYALINRDGKIILQGDKKAVNYTRYGNYLVFRNGNKQGLMTLSGDILIKPGQYNLATVYDGQYITFGDKKHGLKKQGLMRFDNKALRGNATLTEIIPPIFGSVSVDNNFISVSFDGQRHPVRVDGTPIGFSFDDAGSE